MSADYDVAVIGAGPGGSSAALALALGGARVVLLDAGIFPHHKVCGEFISPEALPILQRLGVLNKLRAAGAKEVTTARVVMSQRDTGAIPLPAPALAISRYCMDAILWETTGAAGANCLDRTKVHRIDRLGASTCDGFSIKIPQREITARFIIIATGRNARIQVGDCALQSHSPKRNELSRYYGIKAHFREVKVNRGEVQLFPFPGGYCGMTEIEDGLVNVSLLASYSVQTDHKPDELWRWVLTQNATLADRMKNARAIMPWLATANVSFGHQHPIEEGIIRCGDAAGYIHPLTGDGMGMALRSGELAAATVGAAIKGGLATRDVAPIYGAAWRREFETRLHWGAHLQPLILSPLWSGIAISCFACFPASARLAVQRTRGY
jgi:flavin-dependent dehydrogenase